MLVSKRSRQQSAIRAPTRQQQATAEQKPGSSGKRQPGNNPVPKVTNQWMLWGSRPQHALPLLPTRQQCQPGKRQPGNRTAKTWQQRQAQASCVINVRENCLR